MVSVSYCYGEQPKKNSPEISRIVRFGDLFNHHFTKNNNSHAIRCFSFQNSHLNFNISSWLVNSSHKQSPSLSIIKSYGDKMHGYSPFFTYCHNNGEESVNTRVLPLPSTILSKNTFPPNLQQSPIIVSRRIAVRQVFWAKRKSRKSW